MGTKKVGQYLLFVIILFIFIFIWTRWISPQFKKVPSDLNYSAETLSRDNLYNEQFGKFEGEQISKSSFTYEVIGLKKDILILKNSFNVRTLNDKPIFSVTRLYYINPYTWQQISTEPNNRSGYLFGPQYANKKDFVYWHVNYNAPALMKFVGKEKIDG